jgi:hypothetical protein
MGSTSIRSPVRPVLCRKKTWEEQQEKRFQKAMSEIESIESPSTCMARFMIILGFGFYVWIVCYFIG